MKSLIRYFNEIQEINKELKIAPMKLPQIVVIGSQSSGKSSVLESIVGSDFFPKGKGMITRCPLRLELINGSVSGSEFQARFNHRAMVITSYPEISLEILKETDKRTNNVKSISDDELILEITGPNFPTLTLVDLPGLIQNIENDQPRDLDQRIKDLMRRYIEPKYSIILAISPANVDLATSEIIKYAKEVDPRGERTIHVLTKLDIMNEGESAQDPLNCQYLSDSLAVIGVINRNEKDSQDKVSIDQQRAKEERFFVDKYPQLAKKHGTKYLLTKLEQVLSQEIRKFIPKFEAEVNDNIRKYKRELDNLDPSLKRMIVIDHMNDFSKMYRSILDGNLAVYNRRLEGGALIAQCLYETFVKEIADVMVSHLTDETIYNTVRNTTGTRDVAFSFEKPFENLVRIEIAKFREPCNGCLNEVLEKLNEFVDQVLEKVELLQYPKVAEAVKTIACDIINKRSEKSRKMITNYITSEIHDITFTNPFRDILENVRNYPTVSRFGNEGENTVITPRMIKATVELVGLSLPIRAYYAHINMAVAAFGLTSKLKEAYDAGKNNEVINIINDVIDQGIGLETLKDRINGDLSANIENFMKRFKVNHNERNDSDSISQIQRTQVIIIKNIISLYFEMVRKNIMNYVPKTIQTFLIRELTDKMERKIQVLFYEDSHLKNLICDDDNSRRIENLKNDHEKSLEMLRKLQLLKGFIRGNGI